MRQTLQVHTLRYDDDDDIVFQNNMEKFSFLVLSLQKREKAIFKKTEKEEKKSCSGVEIFVHLLQKA